MSLIAPAPVLDLAAWDGAADEEIIERVRAGETELYEILMRRYNQRLFRAAVAVLGNDAEAEEVMQEAYVSAYQHLNQFAGEAKFSTWLTRIAINEALGRLRRRRRNGGESSLDANLHIKDGVRTTMRNPEQQAYDHELRLVLESAIQALPDRYRSVFVLRAVEGLSSLETAACLDLGEEAVKTRLHRARSLLRKELRRRASLVAAETFPFHLSRCDRVVDAVLQAIRVISPAPRGPTLPPSAQ